MFGAVFNKQRLARIAAPLAVGLALAGAAHGQTMSTNSASFNAGYGRTSGWENQPVDVSQTDANGNLTVVNGQVTSAVSGSIFAEAGASASVSGVGSGFAGAGSSASATAIGNSLNVVTEGNNNTVIVNAVQNNSGDVTATTTVNGR